MQGVPKYHVHTEGGNTMTNRAIINMGVEISKNV